MPKPEAQLPPGTSSFLSGASENFSFHSSPESFIINRILQYHKDRPEEIDKRKTVRAKILNRNVAVVSSYEQIKQVLEPSDGTVKDNQQPPYVATAPYNRLMEPFFPPPNLLLKDGCPHQSSKDQWRQLVQSLSNQTVREQTQTNISTFLQRVPLDAPLDLYATCKDVGWQIFLSTFLNIEPQTPEYNEVEKLQEDLLRGQFSLFPVTVNTGFWHSPRKVGIDARKKLQAFIEKRLNSRPPAWLNAQALSKEAREETVNHLLMSTSSLAVKGFASLMTALLLNVFVFKGKQSGQSVAREITSCPPGEREGRRAAVMKETLRLSPPIVGIMRRTTQQRTLHNSHPDEPDILVPEGWDVWPYFPGGNRDVAVFGNDADDFDPSRYLKGTGGPPEPVAFGLGHKRCLGQTFVEDSALAVLGAFEKQGLGLQGTVDAAGVRAWLGWERDDPGVWAKDMKQLPTQHPAQPVMVRFSKQA
ncbi:hypothetical protein KC360_g6766 [Hortaea werneckii]|nr:hypothetical protein KC361_g6950 [Hortaea werneckii]KAI6881223.1 hypothetical protein KC325_g6655 [Hortaea werneckii]KAI6989311.1 hypothetical protein KC359_g7272 [Hortaea werneckii]KAI7143022.1 hypothetical protein KC344_g6676 [Hortaea werneckii]KAI7170492.1 hypothetical protein KC360_g6766 [Hortaea werneckii]